MIKAIVPISGGKDSQACLKLAVQEFGSDSVLGLFCDTQFEHPLTYAHVEWMGNFYGVNIERITAGSVDEKVLRYGRFPGGGARHCTDELKIAPTRRFLKAWSAPVQVWYGMRSSESHEREKRYSGKVDGDLYAPHEIMPSKYPQYLAKQGVMFRLPILDWTRQEVVDCVGAENLNPLYSFGFDRVGCFPCLAGGDKWKEKAFTHDQFGRDQRERVAVLERAIGKRIMTSKGGRFGEDQGKLFDENGGCAVCAI